MAEESATRSTMIETSMMPPSNSITIGEIENKLIYITATAVTTPERETLDNFIDKKGIIFKSIGIPIKSFQRYSSNKSIENQQNGQANIISLTMNTLFLCYSYFKTSWFLASPTNDKIVSNALVFKHKPSITQQATNYYSDTARNNDFCKEIIKFDYHPLYREIAIAFKNGIVFFDIKRNCWLSNVLQHEMQRNITDFAFCRLGINMAVICGKGVFLWNLRSKRGELIRGSYERVKYSPDSKYIAVYNVNGKFADIYDVYSNKMVYRHQMFYNIVDIEWISSTKSNKYYPARLLFVTNSSYLFLLNMTSFEMETFQCKEAKSQVTHICVSKNGNGIIAITANRYLYYISLKQFSEPSLLADLYLDFSDEEKEENEEKIADKKYLVHSVKWSQCDRRIAIIYKEDDGGDKIARFVSIWAYDFSTLYKLGFITNPHNKTFPLHLTFRDHFNFGALLSICWSNAIISQHHLCFNKSNQLSF